MPINKFYSAPECESFFESKYKSYWAFLYLLNCSDQQFQYFRETLPEDSFEEFNWAYNFLLENLCSPKADIFMWR